VEVIGVHFKIPFCKVEIRKTFPDIGIKIIEVNLSQEFLEVIKSPHHGFGSNMNPCIDCKILMFAKAKEMLSVLGASFIITGEVLGQRPMSQNKQALKLIKQKSGLDDLLLRPLSAKFFPESLAEKQGWVNRDKLLNFNGRRRNPQKKLAAELGIIKYAQAAGGCLLTDPCFSKRLEELLAHQELNLDNLELLKIGRHFRLSKDTRFVVGRNESENNQLAQLAKPGDYLFQAQNDLAGPVSLGRGLTDLKLLELCGQITAAYSDTAQAYAIDVFYRRVPSLDEKKQKVFCVPKSNFVNLLL
jgi:tRNA U34 2-thiouridine synthase MnmA/TrmU